MGQSIKFWLILFCTHKRLILPHGNRDAGGCSDHDVPHRFTYLLKVVLINKCLKCFVRRNNSHRNHRGVDIRQYCLQSYWLARWVLLIDGCRHGDERMFVSHEDASASDIKLRSEVWNQFVVCWVDWKGEYYLDTWFNGGKCRSLAELLMLLMSWFCHEVTRSIR